MNFGINALVLIVTHVYSRAHPLRELDKMVKKDQPCFMFDIVMPSF